MHSTTIYPTRIPLSLLLIVFFIYFSLLLLLLSQQLVISQAQPLNHLQQEEQSILLKLNNDWENPSLYDDSWAPWNPSTFPNHCNWTGIYCDDVDGFVNGILLSGMRIVKKIPPIICDLKSLIEIDLSFNSIPAEFPTLLYNCSKLEILNLSANYFQGRIPDDIDRLSSLRYLYLGNNNFSGEIPASICRFPFLRSLQLEFNGFDGSFPPEIGNLTNLEFLRLGFNMFLPSRIPPEFGKLKKLSQLSMNEANLIGEIPETFGDLSNLEYLDLSYNNLNGTIPRDLFLLKNLSEVRLDNTLLSGEIPSNIKSLNLGEIDLSSEIPGNQRVEQNKDENRILLKLKNGWGNPESLNYSWIPSTFLDHCRWEGITCDYVNGFVTEIDLDDMNLTQKIPPIICDLKNLTHINLFSNFIPGEFPTYLYNCSKLEILDLSDNDFQGLIPDDIDRLSSLRLLKLGNNNFSGDIPASIGRLSFLQHLQLDSNRFNGSFPPEIGNLSNLEFLHLEFNMFLPSRIPPEFGKLKKLYELSMTKTNLMGEIPETIADLSSLEKLDLSNNNLNGTIPSDLFLLKNLIAVHLSNNNLSGGIPSNIETLNLEGIDLSNNRFSGSIPANISRLTSLISFKASNNLLTGEIPMELTSLTNLQTLTLDGNQLSGGIPSTINSSVSLYTLNLSTNQISGELPLELWLLPDLNVLDLSQNQISGEFPSENVMLPLDFLNLSSNKLTGELPDAFNRLEYGRSFLNNSGLCARYQISNLKSCISESSKQAVSISKSSKLSPILLDVIVVVVVTAFLVSIILILFVIKNVRQQKPEQDLAKWDMTSFQKLHFTESDILANLTENNQIGSGGSGEVYRVPIDHLGNYVAVKKIWSDRNLDQKMEKQFQAEVQILGTIRHINIVKLLCCISNKDTKLLVYEYMENGSLYQWLHENNRGLLINWPKRLQIAAWIAQGLSYMHHNCSPPIIHRDVKSSNILLDSDFKAKIADFGLARTLIKQGEPNSASVIAGSFGYIAPEYAHTSKVNEKIDVYSFGVVLLELVTGKKANKGDEYRNLAQWAWSRFHEVDSVDVLMDEGVKEECYLEEMRMVFKLGMICTNTFPSNRPSMNDALQILLKHAPPHQALSASNPGIQIMEE